MYKLLLILLTLVGMANGQNPDAMQYVTEAISEMDDGEYERSRTLLEKARKLDPKHGIYDYEISLSYYYQQNYVKAIAHAEAALKYKADRSARYYQHLGNMYDYAGLLDKAMEAYTRGIKAYPKATGILYTAKGIAYARQGKINEAIDALENSMRNDPTYPGAYYYAATLLSKTESHRLYAVLYGEIFMNIERNTKRTEAISKVLHQVYNDAISVNDTSGSINLHEKAYAISLRGKKDIKKMNFMPFPMVFLMKMEAALALAKNDCFSEQIPVACMGQLRELFTQTWSERNKASYPNILLDYWTKITEAGHMEAYNYWLHAGSHAEAFSNWKMAHYEEWHDFLNWFGQYPLIIDKKHYYVRGMYR